MSIKLTPEGRVLLPIMGIVAGLAGLSLFFGWIKTLIPLGFWMAYTIESAILLFGGFCFYMHHDWIKNGKYNSSLHNEGWEIAGGISCTISLLALFATVLAHTVGIE